MLVKNNIEQLLFLFNRYIAKNEKQDIERSIKIRSKKIDEMISHGLVKMVSMMK